MINRILMELAEDYFETGSVDKLLDFSQKTFPSDGTSMLFVGLMLMAPCYIKFLDNPKNYLSSKLTFIEESKYFEMNKLHYKDNQKLLLVQRIIVAGKPFFGPFAHPEHSERCQDNQESQHSARGSQHVAEQRRTQKFGIVKIVP